jgi:hypothetical protein
MHTEYLRTSLFSSNCSSNFLEHVGIPVISYYDNPDWLHDNDAPSSTCAFIQIPHIHPGRDKYGNQPESLRRVMILCWMATLAIGDYMLEVLGALGDTDELESREAMCQQVIDRYNIDGAALMNKLEEVKTELASEWRNINQPRNELNKERRSQLSTQHARVCNLSISLILGACRA